MLVINDLSAGRGVAPVARLTDLCVAGGQAALLLGPSGSGKTTLLLAIAGLARIFGGAAILDGVDMAGLSPVSADKVRGRNIGLVFQDIHLIAGLSTLQNLLLAPYAAGAPQDRVRARQLLEALDLAQVEGRPAETLSRGQAQRVAIARAMLIAPKLILADEPTSSLDDAATETVADLLLTASAETGAALLIATHDQRLRRRISTWVEVEPIA